jgi:hypothetical protein
LDNDNKGADWKNNPFCVQYVRVWRLEPLAAAAGIVVDCPTARELSSLQ